MKTILTCIVFICSVPICLSQEIIGKSYITNAANIEIRSVTDTSKTFKIPVNTKFRVDGFAKDKGRVLISFWQYNDSSVKAQQEAINKSQYDNKSEVVNALNKDKKSLTASDISSIVDYGFKFIGPWANYVQFDMKLEDLNDKTQEYYGYSDNFTYGVMTLPIKLRFGNNSDRFFNFEENLNLGFTFGYQRKISSRVKQAHNILGGVGISRVTVDEDSLTEGITTSDNTSEALMLNLGYLYQYEAFQVGLFLGTDLIPGSLGREWKFQGKPWLGIAIGVSLFSNNDRKSSEGKNE
ncbi:MAG: hypothetical protein KDD04_01820 [Sinomicrobium sp.]|nr:hypothetical protein [Sinomicrobium sp.]